MNIIIINQFNLIGKLIIKNKETLNTSTYHFKQDLISSNASKDRKRKRFHYYFLLFVRIFFALIKKVGSGTTTTLKLPQSNYFIKLIFSSSKAFFKFIEQITKIIVLFRIKNQCKIFQQVCCSPKMRCLIFKNICQLILKFSK